MMKSKIWLISRPTKLPFLSADVRPLGRERLDRVVRLGLRVRLGVDERHRGGGVAHEPVEGLLVDVAAGDRAVERGLQDRDDLQLLGLSGGVLDGHGRAERRRVRRLDERDRPRRDVVGGAFLHVDARDLLDPRQVAGEQLRGVPVDRDRLVAERDDLVDTVDRLELRDERRVDGAAVADDDVVRRLQLVDLADDEVLRRRADDRDQTSRGRRRSAVRSPSWRCAAGCGRCCPRRGAPRARRATSPGAAAARRRQR